MEVVTVEKGKKGGNNRKHLFSFSSEPHSTWIGDNVTIPNIETQTYKRDFSESRDSSKSDVTGHKLLDSLK